jgi:actin-related protein 6
MKRFKDVRSMIEEDYELNVEIATDPLEYSLNGGKCLSNNDNDYNDIRVTRKQYEEHGHNICKKKFDLNYE